MGLYRRLEWVQNGKGNYVQADAGWVKATVFQNKWGSWQIIINGFDGGLVKNEGFVDPDDAIDRAEDILDGARCCFAPLKRWM